jgi:2-polyprenyl-6-methoxyphenol hydroxylase-like FAD-dependent oxidoreductase
MIDVVIVGGGFSGTLAAVLLARAGYRVALVDRHPVYPDDFRAGHLDQVQTEALNRMQLLDRIVSDAPCVRYVVAASHGRVAGLWPTINYGIRYDSMVNAARTLLPPCAELVIGRVADLETGPVHQRITLADGRVLTARLLVLATGLGYALCSKLGIGRRVLHERHSLTFGFDMQPIAGDRFPFPFLVYQGERVLNQIDYLAAFEIGATMRANLFTYRDYRDPWTQAMLREPDRVLNEVLPGLAKVIGAFRVCGPVSGACHGSLCLGRLPQARRGADRGCVPDGMPSGRQRPYSGAYGCRTTLHGAYPAVADDAGHGGREDQCVLR